MERTTLLQLCPDQRPLFSPFPQVDDQNDHCRNQQNMNQAAGNMKAETQQPEDHENRENCPKHFFLFLRIVAPRGVNIPGEPQCTYNGRLVARNRLCLCLPDCIQERMGRGRRGNLAEQKPAGGDVRAIDSLGRIVVPAN